MEIFSLILGLAVLVIFFIAYVIYDKNSQTPDGKTRSFFLFILGMLISGLVAEASVAFFVIDRVCSGEFGAGCSFGVSVILQPIGWIVGMGGFVYLWIKTKPVNQMNLSSEDKTPHA